MYVEGRKAHVRVEQREEQEGYIRTGWEVHSEEHPKDCAAGRQ